MQRVRMIIRIIQFLFAALLFFIVTPFPGTSAADDAKPKAGSALASGDAKSKPKKRNDDSTTLSYRTPEDLAVYRIEVTNRFTDTSVRTLVGEVAYRHQPIPVEVSSISDSPRLSFAGTIQETRTKQGSRSRPFFQLGDFNSGYMTGFSGMLILDSNSPVVRADLRGGTVDGLPWSYGELAFPTLPEDDNEEWTDHRKLAVVRSSQHSFRLVDSDRVNMLAGPGVFFGSERPVAPTVTFTVTSKRRATKGRETIVHESIRFDGQHLDPKILITGKGILHFDHQLGAYKSIERDLEVEIKDDANATKYPISIRLDKLAGKELDEFVVADRKREEIAKKSMQERAAKLKSLPGLNDRDALFKLLESGEDVELSTTLNNLMRDPELKEDEELGMALYRSIFRSRTISYTAAEMLKTVWPKLHQSASIAKDYWGSFDVGLTGDVITDETKLIRGQYVCYPMYGRWQAGEFYGAVEDVVVIQSKDHDKALKVFRRSECRMPSPQFVDPAVMDKSTNDTGTSPPPESP